MRTSVAVDLLLESWTDEQRQMCDVLRGIILEASPAIVESFKFHIPFYTMNGFLFYISPLKKGSIQLAFCQGRLMDDFEKLFVGHDRKEVRHIVLHTIDSAPFEAIQAYVFEAVALNKTQRSFTKRKT
jgi:hypothetical protein